MKDFEENYVFFFLLNFEFTSISSNFPEGGQEISKLFLNYILIFRKPYCF